MSRGAFIRIAVLLALAVWSRPALAQVGSRGAAEERGPSHGWVVLDTERGPVLVHVPPRDGGIGHGAAEPGTARRVRMLNEQPDAMVAIGDRVYLFFPHGATAEGSVRRVLSLRAVPSGIEGLWSDVPRGLLDPVPSLPTADRIVGATAAGGRVWVLTRGLGSVGLWRLDPDGWVSVGLPVEPSEPVGLALTGFGDGVLVALRDESGTAAWSTRGVDAAWQPVDLADWGRFWDARWRAGFGSGVIALVPQGSGGSAVWSLTTGGAWRLGEIGDSAGVPVLLPASGRLVVLRSGDDGTIGSHELSVVTGRTIFDGERAPPVAMPANEFRLIVLVVLLTAAAALFVIIRPAGERSWGVPDGWALADPGRRLLASVVDAFLVAWVVAPVFGVSARQVVTLEVLIHPSEAWLAIPATLVGGWVAMSVWEALLGLTPGKALVGIRVFRARAGVPMRVSLFWCLVRNAVKWLLPPVAAAALLDPQGRHRGDTTAGAVVVVRARGAELDPG